MHHLKFRLISIILIIQVLNGLLISQNNYSQFTIEELQGLRENKNIAIAKNDSLSIARASYKLALKFDYIGESDSADFYYIKALSIAYCINNSKAIAVISNSLATTYSDKGLHDKALKVYSEVVERFLSLSDTSEAASVMLNISSEYMEVGEYEKALQIALSALDLRLVVADSNNISAFYQQIGIVFSNIGNKQKWKEYILIANSLAKKNDKYGDFYRRMDILKELGAYYLDEGNLPKAESYYDSLFTQSKKNNYLQGEVNSLINLVPILKEQKRYSKAFELSTRALKLSEKVNNTYKTILNLIEIAKLEIILGKNNFAENKLLRAKKLAEEYNYPNELVLIYKLLSEINFDKNNYKTAYRYSQKYQTLKDSIKSSETQNVIAELETKYRSEKKDNKITLLNKENLLKQERIDKQKRTVIIIIILALSTIALFALFYMQTKLKSKNRILNLNNRLLRTQMNPHFMFNALIAIQNYVLRNKKFEASDYLSKFATLMRSILQSSRTDFHSLTSEIESLNNYVSLQQLRFENSFKFVLEVDENIDTESLQIPPMLIQPFIENAIEHGFSKIADDEKILTVKYFSNNNVLNILIEDNGMGIKQSIQNKSDNKHQSFAMEITHERLANIKKLYNERITISIQDLLILENKNGTQIKFEIPLSLITKV